MITLTINDLPVAMPTGFNFKLTVDNPRFGESGTWSFEISLPLRGCRDNIRIFGPLHHTQLNDLSRLPEYTFKLIADYITLEGQTIVTGVTDEVVKIQLLAGTSVFSFSWKTEDGVDKYIDELPLGWAWGSALAEWNKHRYDEGFIDLSDNDFVLLGLNRPGMEYAVHGTVEETDAVAFPIYSTLDEKRANSHEWRIDYNGNARYYFKGVLTAIPDGKIACQPYLKAVLNRIVQALGFTFAWDEYEPQNTWMKNIFIANARNSDLYADALPHWTVEEFFKQLRLCLGLYAEQRGTHIYIRFLAPRDMPIVELHHIIDEHTVEEGEPEDDFTNISVEYDIDDPILKLPEEVWQRALVETYETKEALEARVQYEPFKGLSRWIFRIGTPEDGEAYALLSNTQGVFNLSPVDLLPPYVKHPNYDGRGKLIRRCDETLKMQPCRMELHDIERVFDGKIDGEVIGELPILSTDETRVIDRSYYSVDLAINKTDEEQEQEPEKSDIMHLALNTGNLFAMRAPAGHMYEIKDTPCPIGIPWIKGDPGYERFPGFDETPYWELDGKRGKPNNIFTTTRQGDWLMDTSYVYEFDFLDDLRPEDINSIFIIKGRPYLCKRIEYTLQKDSIAPLKKGFFYPCDRTR